MDTEINHAFTWTCIGYMFDDEYEHVFGWFVLNVITCLFESCHVCASAMYTCYFVGISCCHDRCMLGLVDCHDKCMLGSVDWLSW